MAKQKTICSICGGSYDGTPSGQSKHEATLKHLDAQETADRIATGAQSLDPGDVIPGYGTAKMSVLIQSLSILITDKEQELARRQIDHKYRERHSADNAPAYYSSKVAPLREEIEVLRAARKAIGGAS
jgi:hypothetical protein